MQFHEVLSIFNEKFKEIQLNAIHLSNEANEMIGLCNTTLNDLRKIVSNKGFKSGDSEIRFFKEVKVIPMQYLIFYTEVRSCEFRIPKIGIRRQLQFLEEQMDKVNRFFGRHTEFLIYIDQGYHHFDKFYFTRKYLNDAPLIIKSYPYYKDSLFNTSHDGVLARIRAYGLFANYLKEKKHGLENMNHKLTSEERKSEINWTGSYAAFVELLYGCDAMGYFNKGNIAIGKVVEELGEFLNVPKGNYSRTYNELKNRRHSQIKFFEEAGQKLLDKMDRKDSITKK